VQEGQHVHDLLWTALQQEALLPEAGQQE